jgi:hypothetical protein
MEVTRSIPLSAFSIAPSAYAFPGEYLSWYQAQLLANAAFTTHQTYTFEEKAVFDDIEHTGELKADWDGDGALPIQEQTKNNALLAARSIVASAPVPGIAPNPNGTISMEWETNLGSGHLEIGRTKYSFYLEAPGCKLFTAQGSVDKMVPYLGLLVSRYLFPPAPGGTSITLQGNVQHTR